MEVASSKEGVLVLTDEAIKLGVKRIDNTFAVTLTMR
jgi:hypothetical protein